MLLAGGIVLDRQLRRRAERTDALLLAKERKHAAAIPLLERTLARAPNDPELLQALASSLVATGKLTEAEETLGRWVAVQPDDAAPYLARIDLWLLRRQLPPAIEDARRALQHWPADDELRERRTQWLWLTGHFEEADAECRRCRERRPDAPALRQLEAEIAHRRGDAARAAELLDGLLREQPGSPPALILRAALHLDADRPEQAIPLLRRAIASGPMQPQRARHYLALALARTGKADEAARVLAEVQQFQAVELWEQYGRSDAVGYKLRLAEALMATGQAADAVRLLERAVAQDPDCAEAHRRLAEHFEARGERARAAEHRRKAG